ncbi:DNA polymerase IV [Candidatus Uhrbacteria bacterium]|nr:DNA polymerase IV [Candidatus Uhrbacteria bacterium]
MSVSPSNKLIAHVDMNSYFASVEQQANPHLRGRALGVCAYLHRHGCVIAASVEAKRLGMKVGMTVEEAVYRVPSAVFVENDPPKYRAVTSRVFSILHGLTDRVEHYSIDEAFLDLTGWYRDAAEAAWALTRVRRRILDEVGEWLRCSIGIAPTRFLAKTASDIEKPNGLVVIDASNLDDILSRLDLEDVCGIGPRIRRRLERAGIRTLIDLKRTEPANLMRLFGSNGYFLWAKVNGLEVETVRTEEEIPPKSIGHSYCVPDRVNREGRVVAVFTRLVERAGRRLRRLGLLAGTVSVAVGFRDPPGGASDWTRLDEPASDSFTLTEAACDILRDLWHPSRRVGFLAVTLSEFSEPTGQGRFLDGTGYRVPGTERDRKRRASSAADLIRDRYGDEAIMFGSMMGAGDHAPDRIGFRKTGDLELSR